MLSNDPLHSKTLEVILTHLVDHYGWKQLGILININCFNSNPSIKSCLTFAENALGTQESRRLIH